MSSAFLAVSLAAAAAATPDAALVAALGHPEYRVRVAAQTLLLSRCVADVYPDTVVTLVAVLRTTQNYEIRDRAATVVSASTAKRVVRAYETIDLATGFDYPCVDALWFDPASGQYDHTHPAAVRYRESQDGDPPPEFPDLPGRTFHAYRTHTRRLAAQALVAGVTLPEVLAELDRLHRLDARYCLLRNVTWDGRPAPFVFAVLRWDSQTYAAAAAPAPTPVPIPVPAVMPPPAP